MKKNIKRKLRLNTVSAMINQIVNTICSFILPRLILINYGSTINGLITSISQFLGFVSLMEMGIGAVVQSSLYKPLVDNNTLEISKILYSANKFFKNIAKILCIYTIILMFTYKFFVNTKFDTWFVAIMVFILSINSFAQYYFGIVNQLLLNADQKSYIPFFLNTASIIINTAVGALLIYFDISIEVIKATAALILMIKPLGMYVYVKNKYKFDNNIEICEEPIKQKWNGLFHHIASFVLLHTDIVVLSLFSTLENVSIYGIYQLVTNGLNQIVTIFTTGTQAMFGELYYKNDKSLPMEFDRFEWLTHSLITFIFTIAAILISSFIGVYVNGIDSTNYIQPTFGVILVAAQGMCCLRMPYNILVKAVGHYKQTQNCALLEAILNIVISIIMVKKLGLVGVAIGTFVAMSYRTIYLAYYTSKYIFNREFNMFIKHIVVDMLVIVSICLLSGVTTIEVHNYYDFIYNGLLLTVFGLCITGIINGIAYNYWIK